MAEEDKLTIKLPKKASRVKTSNAEESKKIKIVLSKSETKAESAVKSETDTRSKTDTKTATKSEIKAEPATKSETDTRSKTATKSEIKAEPATKSEISMASSLVQLKEHCKQLGIKGISKKNKTELLEIIKNHN